MRLEWREAEPYALALVLALGENTKEKATDLVAFLLAPSAG